MKIDNNMMGGINSYRNEGVQRNQSEAPERQQTKQGAGFDRVEFSMPREQLAKLKQALEEMPDVRQDRVAAVRDQMISGTYNISGRAVAAKMLGVSDE